MGDVKSSVQNIMDGLVKQNPEIFSDMKSRVERILSGKGYLDALLYGVDNPDKIRKMITRTGITDPLLDALPKNHYIQVESPTGGIISVGKIRLFFYKEDDDEIVVYWNIISEPKDRLFKTLSYNTKDSHKILRDIAFEIASNHKTTMHIKQFASDIGISEPILQSTMKDIVMGIGITDMNLSKINDNNYIQITYTNPQPVTSETTNRIPSYTMYITNTGDDFTLKTTAPTAGVKILDVSNRDKSISDVLFKLFYMIQKHGVLESPSAGRSHRIRGQTRRRKRRVR